MEKEFGGTIGASEQPNNSPGSSHGWYTGSGTNSGETRLFCRETAFTLKLDQNNVESISLELLTKGNNENKPLGAYWLSTRYLRYQYNYSSYSAQYWFGLFYLNSSSISYKDLEAWPSRFTVLP